MEGVHVLGVLLVHLIHVGLVDVRRDGLWCHPVVLRLIHIENVGSLGQAGRLRAIRDRRLRGVARRDTTITPRSIGSRRGGLRSASREWVERVRVRREGGRRVGATTTLLWWRSGPVLAITRVDLEAGRARSGVLTTHLKGRHHGLEALVARRVAGGKTRHAELVLLVVLRLAARLRDVRRIGRLQVGDRQTNLLDQTAISLSGDDLQLNENAFGSLDVTGALSRVHKGAGKDFVHDGNTIDLIAKNVGQDVVSWGVEQSLDDLLGSLRLDFLIDDTEHRQRRQLVGAQVREVGCKTRCEEVVARREARRVKKPCQQQCSVWVGGQRNRVEDYSGGEPTLLVEGDIGALKAGPHTASAEATLRDLPETIHHRIK